MVIDIADASKLTEKERIFADEYIKTTNATQSAIKAGYSKRTARSKGSQLLTKVNIMQYIDEVMGERSKDTIASADEVMEMLTAIMRGEVKDAFGLDPSLSDRLKATELMGKRYMLFTDKVKMDAEVKPVMIVGG